ncbi:MAG: amidohydrolase [Deltaproteobacteria bacterium]|nr:amidohydrolase [Deltaproteobacteria bacterium]
MKDKKKDKLVIDMCVIPPLEETIEGFANPDGDFAKYADLYGKGNTESFLSSIKSDPVGFLLSLMDDAGVDIAVLPAEDAETTMGMKTPNEKVAAFVSLCIEPWLHKLRSNDKLYYPIYAKCIELDIPVWIHSSINYVPQLTMDFGRPIYLDEVAGHFPELKIIAGHGGWPWVDEMMALLWRHSNVYTDISAIRPKYLDTPGTGWASIIRYGNSLLQDKILFGTAWPAQQFKESIEEIKVLPLKEEVKDKWLGGNAKQLLGL